MKIYKNVTVTITEDDNIKSNQNRLTDMLLNMSDSDVRNALREVARINPKTIIRIAQSCHGRLYDIIGLGR